MIRAPCATIFMGLILIGFYSGARAEKFGYSPESPFLAVGKGVAGIDFANTRPDCISYTTKPLIRNAGHTIISIVHNQEELSQALEVDTKASVGILGQSGSGYLDLRESSSTHKVAFSIVIESVQEANGLTMASSPTWKEPYGSLIAQGKLPEVRRDCGDRYIQSEIDDARLLAVIDVYQEAESFGLHVNTGGSANINIPVGSISGSVGSEADFKRAAEHNALSVRAYYQGLGGLKDAAALVRVTAQDSIVDIQRKISEALADNKIVGQPAGYDLTPYPGMPLVADLSDPVELFLKAVKQRVEVAALEQGNIDCVAQMCDARGRSLDNQEKQEVQRYSLAYGDYVTKLRSAFVECASHYAVDAADCQNNLIPQEPSRPDVAQLSLLIPPIWGKFHILVNQMKWLDDGEVDSVLKGGDSLLVAAQRIYPSTTSVDVYADILSPFFSVGETVVPPELAAVGVSDYQAIAKTDVVSPVAPSDFSNTINTNGGFGPPPGIKTILATNNMIPLLHADSNNRCALDAAESVLSESVKIYSDSCYSSISRRLANSTLDGAMTFVISEWARSKGPKAYGGVHKVPVMDVLLATLTTQYGQQATVPYGKFKIDYTSNGFVCGYTVVATIIDAAGNRIDLQRRIGVLH